MNLLPAGVVRGDAVVLAVVDQNIGIRDAGRRAVQIVDRRGPVGFEPLRLSLSNLEGRSSGNTRAWALMYFCTLDGVFRW